MSEQPVEDQSTDNHQAAGDDPATTVPGGIEQDPDERDVVAPDPTENGG